VIISFSTSYELCHKKKHLRKEWIDAGRPARLESTIFYLLQEAKKWEKTPKRSDFLLDK